MAEGLLLAQARFLSATEARRPDRDRFAAPRLNVDDPGPSVQDFVGCSSFGVGYRGEPRRCPAVLTPGRTGAVAAEPAASMASGDDLG